MIDGKEQQEEKALSPSIMPVHIVFCGKVEHNGRDTGDCVRRPITAYWCAISESTVAVDLYLIKHLKLVICGAHRIRRSQQSSQLLFL